MAYQQFNWTCPYCNRDQVVTEAQRHITTDQLRLAATKYGLTGYTFVAIACSNRHCGEVTIRLQFSPGKMQPGMHGPSRFKHEGPTEDFNVRPSSTHKAQPASVPEPLRLDYYEACAIRDLSPKASATLSRRILQGAIRDFCGISKNRLVDEIDALKALADAGDAPRGVDPQTIDAMHHIRSIGNIGAHMEKDINVIVDVDPTEAQALIGLVEMLFKDWYVARHDRDERLAQVKAMAEQKAAGKKV